MCTRQAALQLWLVFLNKSNDDAGGLARVLPYLAHGNAAAQAALLDHYTACLDLAAFDAAGAQQQQVRLLLGAEICYWACHQTSKTTLHIILLCKALNRILAFHACLLGVACRVSTHNDRFCCSIILPSTVYDII